MVSEMRTTTAWLFKISVSRMSTSGSAGYAGTQELCQDSCQNSCPDHHHGVPLLLHDHTKLNALTTNNSNKLKCRKHYIPMIINAINA